MARRYEGTECPADKTEGETSDGRDAWIIKGELAIAHACRVHDEVHQQILGFSQVSAVDVGFAIRERRKKFANFLTLRVHVNRKRPPEQLTKMGIASFTSPHYAMLRENSSGFGLRPLRRNENPDYEGLIRNRRIKSLLSESPSDWRRVWRELPRYPIGGIHNDDFSLYYSEDDSAPGPGELRLCICGVPVDIINAHYNPSVVSHPGGDDDRGVFVEPPQRTNHLSQNEQILTGRGRVNPIVGGVSVGNASGQTGTLGTIVWDRTDGTPCLLSNWHVLAGSPRARVGQPTYQPALSDGGTEADIIAHLKRWHIGQEGDAAVSELSGKRHYAAGETLGLWHPISGYCKPTLGLEIRKWGRTTGFTQGFIDGIHLATNISYGNEVVRFFRYQFHIAPLFFGESISQAGDSGSVVVTSYKPLVLQDQVETLLQWLDICRKSRTNFLGQQILSTIESLKTGFGAFAEHHKVIDLLDSLAKGINARPRIEERVNSFLAIEPREESVATDIEAQNIAEHPIIETLKLSQRLEEVSFTRSALTNVISLIQPFQELSLDTRDFSRYIEERLEKFLANHDSVEGFSETLKEMKKIVRELNDDHFAQLLSSNLLHDSAVKTAGSNESLLHISINRKEAQEYDSLISKLKDEESTGSNQHQKKTCLDLFREVERLLGGFRKASSILDRSCTICEISRQHMEKWLSLLDPKACRGRKINFESLCADLEECSQFNQRPSDLIGSVTKKQRKRSRDENSLPTSLANLLLRIVRAAQNPEFLFDEQPDWFRELSNNLFVSNKTDGWLEYLAQIAHSDSIYELSKTIRNDRSRRKAELQKNTSRVYLGVGLIFAGDTPGSPFGEFAIASDIERIADKLRFSLRPVFEPRSSFRELRERPQAPMDFAVESAAAQSFTPRGQGDDPRGGGPQPEVEPFQRDPNG